MAKAIDWYEHRSKEEKKKWLFLNYVFFWKNMENVIKHRNIKFVTAEIRRNSLVSKQNCYTTKFFMKYPLAIEI